MNISSLRCALPFWSPPEGEQTVHSYLLRISAVALGSITLLIGLLAMSNIPGLHGLGMTGGWSLTASGGLLLISGISLKCLKRISEQPSVSHLPVEPIIERKVKPQPRLPSFLDIVDPFEASATSKELIVPAKCAIPPADGSCLLHIDHVSYDMCVYIASFLGPRDQLKGMEVSKEFHAIMHSKILWSRYLAHPEYRIWGATRWDLTYTSGRYLFASESETFENEPYQQLRMYHELREKGEIGPANEFFDYLARLMPGGPIAFNSIPSMHLENALDLQPGAMSMPIVRGTDNLNRYFFAMRLVNRGIVDAEPIVLLFTRPTTMNGWMQEANLYWGKDELKVTNKDVLNYLLALIGKKSHFNRENFSPILKNTIELV